MPTTVAATLQFNRSVVGRRLEIQWLDSEPDPATGLPPWYPGKVAEFRPTSRPPTHLVVYDDGEHKEEHLHSLLAHGCLRWLTDQAPTSQGPAGRKAPDDGAREGNEKKRKTAEKGTGKQMRKQEAKRR